MFHSRATHDAAHKDKTYGLKYGPRPKTVVKKKKK